MGESEGTWKAPHARGTSHACSDVIRAEIRGDPNTTNTEKCTHEGGHAWERWHTQHESVFLFREQMGESRWEKSGGCVHIEVTGAAHMHV
jgi:hypothetical protein